MTDLEDRITTAEAARILGVSRQRASLIVRTLPSSVLVSSRVWLSSRSEVVQWTVDHAERRKFAQEIQRRAKSAQAEK